MAHVLLVNPSSPRKHKRRGKKRSVRRNPVRAIKRRRGRRGSSVAGLRRYRRNPSTLGGLGLTGYLMPVALGAGGALLTDIAIDKLPIPIDFKFGNKRHLAKVGVAVALGFGVGKVMGRDKGAKVMAGALIVVAYDFMKQMLQKQLAPAVGSAGAVNGMGMYDQIDYDSNDMGALLMSEDMGEMDYEENDMGELLYH